MTTKSSSSEILNNNTPIKNSNSSSSRYLPTVCLEDWWLLKSEDGKRLCIGGLVLSENRAKRVFSSAPITKRHSLMSLKSADGINILIQGPINNSRSQENGFSPEVCSRFIVGFPFGWEDVADQCLDQESAGDGAPASMSSFDESKEVLTSLSNKKTFTNMKSEEPEDLSCSYDTGMDEVVKESPASTNSDVKNADSNEAIVAVAVPVGILSTKLAKAKGGVKKGKVGRKKKKGTKSRSISGSTGCGVVQVHLKEDISHVSEGKLERSVSETPIVASPSVQERSGSCNSHTMDESTLQSIPKANVSCSIEVGLDKTTSSRLNNKNIALDCCNDNVNSIPEPRLEAIETQQKKFLISSCVPNPSSSNIDNVKEIMCSPNSTRTASRIKILGNNLKNNQPTNSKILREREKVDFVSLGSVSVNSKVTSTDGKLGGTSTPDQPNVQLQGTIPGKPHDDHYSKDGLQTDFMRSPVPTGAVEKINSGSGIDGTEGRELRKSCTSFYKVGDVKDASDLVSKGSEESKHSQLEMPGSIIMKEKVPALPSSNTKRKKQSSTAQERANLNVKRTRSGRLLLPP
ncbi:kinetochore-associated protein KNL-2 homolog isoform X2 [Papaver somniferum]|uniref:kinetochore-associated protein KNL-2 homolog isoform X2 n=1 Tax=Papaver somniferum TaxID=3469 RepID=UPI000E6F6A8B|nr:kinetochore-associated protein KNL-2 homolog isoform X2 [Papaver somniferum]